MKRKYNYFYKITNHINNHFYYGVHCTDNLDDGYMGSGTRLKYAYKKYGIENFSKEILKFFDTIAEAYKYEAEIVTEDLVYNSDCYNVQCGGKGWNTNGTVSVIDKDGNRFRCSLQDPKYLNGEYIATTKNQITVKDKNGKYFNVSKNDLRYLSGELVGTTSGRIYVKHKKTGILHIFEQDDPHLNSDEYELNIAIGICEKGTVTVKDNNGNIYNIDKNDPRYLNKELKPLWCGKHHSAETKKKMSHTHNLNKHQQGEKNSMHNRKWMHKIDNEKILCKPILKNEIDKYLNNGWSLGRVVNKKEKIKRHLLKKERICKVCGKHYYHIPHTETTKTMCSKECSIYYKKHRKEFLSEESLQKISEGGKKSKRTK